jgi:hypothetical protein
MSSWIRIALVSAVLGVPLGHARLLAHGTSRVERIASFYQKRDGFRGTVAVARESKIGCGASA